MGLAAVDQINFTLPANVPTGCAVPVQISVKGVLSAPVSIAIAPAGATACVSSTYTTQQLQTLDQGGTINHGGFTLSHDVTTAPSSATTDSIAGSFSQVTSYQLSSSDTQNVTVTTIGSCTVVHAMIASTTAPAPHLTNFDAGTVTLTGPSGTNLTNQKLTETTNTYSYTIGQPSGSILAGTYNLTGAGGTDVGPFNTSLTLGPPLSLNNPLPATVTESAGLTINWTGGNASDPVDITGYSGTVSGTGANAIANATEFICTTTAGQKTFTVPAAVLTLLPAITAAQVNAGTVSGALNVTSSLTPVNFNATLKKDGSTIPSVFSYTSVTGGSVLYQ
jgi:flagellar hook-associated protein FlgK